MRLLFHDFNVVRLLEDENHPCGGATVQAHHWIRGLLLQRHAVGVLSERQPRKPLAPPFDELAFIKCFELSKGPPILNWVFYRYPALRAAMQGYQPDIVYHSGAGFTTWAVARACRSLGIPLVYRIANDADADGRLTQRLSPLRRHLYKRSLRMMDLILCQNRYQERIADMAPPGTPIRVLLKPFSTTHQPEVILPFEERRYVAWIGRFVAQKNMPLLLRLAESLPEVCFSIAGELGGQSDYDTREAVRRLKELPNVEFVGYLRYSEVLPFLGRAYCLLNTSVFEGFPNTFLEAFSVGTPVVTNSRADPDGTIQEHRVGYAGATREEISAAIERLLSRHDYEELSARCRDYLGARHDLAAQTAKLVEMLRPLSRSYGGRRPLSEIPAGD